MNTLFGIDYGSKLAGTTVICYNLKEELHLICSAKKQDADEMILDAVRSLNPKSIALDAPLSLPQAYYTNEGSFFYRKVDQKLKAMSPMFLGGLTARAMNLRRNIGKEIEVYETYPAAAIRELQIQEAYNKKDKTSVLSFVSTVCPILPYPIKDQIDSYHAADALVAWLSAYRKETGVGTFLGDEVEGGIWI